LADNNPGSLEKCIDSLQAFIDNGDPIIIASAQNDIIKSLIEKCLGHTKPAIKSKGHECFLMIFEVSEKFEESFETIIEMLNSKNAKVGNYSKLTLPYR
jgi:hypothetical protein